MNVRFAARRVFVESHAHAVILSACAWAEESPKDAEMIYAWLQELIDSGRL